MRTIAYTECAIAHTASESSRQVNMHTPVAGCWNTEIDQNYTYSHALVQLL